MAKTGFVTSPAFLEHDTGPGHPERAARLKALVARIDASDVAGELERADPRAATDEEILRVHTPDHLERVRAAGTHGLEALDGDTLAGPGSWNAARLGAGGLLAATERVLAGSWQNAFCAVRPPGHHAERDRAMGFCLLGNVSIAAEHALAAGLERVAILDWDVHHGNGTQHVFESRADVFYASLHQWPLYPGTGASTERGLGDGEGATLNRPMPAGSGDADWLRAVEDSVLPELEAFRPELVFISAGFDAHRLDPLAGVDLTEDGYRALTRRMLELARSTSGGRLVSVLEGGYHLDALASSVEAHLEELVCG